MITIKDIAAATNLAIGTVSQILNNNDCRYSSKTKDKVLKTAKELGYQPNTLARGIRTGKTGIIGLIYGPKVLHYISHNTSNDTLPGVESELLLKKYNILVSSISSEEIKNFEIPYVIKSGMVEGVILVGFSKEDEYIKFLYSKYGKIVMINEAPQGVPAVLFDNSQGGELIAEHFWELGCRTFAFIGADEFSQNLEERFWGFQKRIGILSQGNSVISRFNDQRWSETAGANAAKAIYESGKIPEAIFCANDFYAVNAIRELDKYGIKVPRDVIVAGFDNLPNSQLFTPSLTTVKIDFFKIGQLAAHYILEILDNKHDKNKQQRIEPVSLERRNSTVVRKKII